MMRIDDNRDINYNDDINTDSDTDDDIQHIKKGNVDSSLSLSGNETDERDFHPELFGLLDDPGVMRFDCLDYPLAVTEDSDEEYDKKHQTDNHWIKVSCDELANRSGDKLTKIESDSDFQNQKCR